MELTNKILEAGGKIMALIVVCTCIGMLLKIGKNEKR